MRYYQRNPGRERRTFPGSRTTNWRRYRDGHGAVMWSRCSVTACGGVRVAGRPHAADSWRERSASDAESWSVSPCCARTAPRHSSSPMDANCHTQPLLSELPAKYVDQGLCNRMASIRLSVPFAACDGFAADGPAGRRYPSTTA